MHQRLVSAWVHPACAEKVCCQAEPLCTYSGSQRSSSLSSTNALARAWISCVKGSGKWQAPPALALLCPRVSFQPQFSVCLLSLLAIGSGWADSSVAQGTLLSTRKEITVFQRQLSHYVCYRSVASSSTDDQFLMSNLYCNVNSNFGTHRPPRNGASYYHLPSDLLLEWKRMTEKSTPEKRTSWLSVFFQISLVFQVPSRDSPSDSWNNCVTLCDWLLSTQCFFQLPWPLTAELDRQLTLLLGIVFLANH